MTLTSTHGSKQSLSSTISFYCHNYSLLKTKIAINTFHKTRYPHIFEKAILLLDFLQLISQIILINPAQYENITFSERPLTKGMVYCSQIINPSHLLSYENSDILTAVCLLIVLCFSILRALLFLAVVYISSRGLNNNSWLIDLWKLIFTLQRPVLCYFITSFWVRAMIAAQDSTFTMLGMSDLGLMVLSCFMFGFEYIFTFLIETQFCYILPSKSFLACKNYKVQATTLAQKIVIQIFQLGMINPDTVGNRWILSTVTLVFSFVRNFQHYVTLPLYKLEALSFQSTILGIGISLHLSYFFQTFMKAVSYGGTDISYLLILWVVLLPACVLICQRLFREKIEALFLSKTRGLPEVLLHKVIATIELKKKEKVPGIQTEKYTWNYLVSVAQKMRLKKTFNIDVEFTEDISESINQVEHANRIYTYYLEKLLDKFPQNKVIKLYLAYFYAKKTKLYAKATKVISEIGQSAWSTIGLNASLLVYDIQKSIIKGHYSDNSQLDLSRYIESQTVVEQLKFKIIEQLDLKIKVIRNIIGEKADLGEVSECALLFDKHKSEIERRISLLYNMIPDYYMEPLLICADYYLVMDYSLEQYLRYEKLYYHKLSKYEKPLKEGNLVEENMYETDNVFIILSGQKIDNGRILYCSKSIEDVCGGDHATYINSHVSRLFTPALQNFYTEFFRQALETGDGILNTRVRGYVNHKEGHAVEVEFCVKVHPFITENLYLNLMLRPVPLTSEYLLVKENGDIEGASKDISEVLGINWTFQTGSPLANVKALSDELALMNEAYNNANKKEQPDSVTLFGKKVSTMVLEDINNSPTLKSLSYFNIQRVKTVDYDLDLAEGKKIQLKSLRRRLSYSSNPDSKFYHCKISGAVYGTVFLKRIALDMTRGTDDHSRDHQLSFADSSARKRYSSAKLKNKKFSLEVFEVSDVGDEKQGGWIDFLSFRSGIESPDSPTGHRNKADESHTNLLSPSRKSTKRLLVSTERTKSLKHDHSLSAIPDVELEVNVDKKIQSPAKLLKKKKTGPVSGSQSLASPAKRRTYKSFKAAVTTKFYPRSFKMLCFGFYTVILLTFFVQIGLRIITDSAISDLVIKKNMLNDSQSRMFNLIRIQSLARTSLEYIVLRLTPAELGSATATAASPLGDVARLMVPLIAANQDISSNLGYLSNSMRDELAMTDIRLYGSCDEGLTSSYQNFTIYQATDILISAGKTSTLISNVYTTLGQNAVTFMTWNMMNDILLKNAKITSELTKSVADQKDYLQNLLIYSLVIILIFLIATGAVLTFNIWYQYSIDKRHILELLRLNHVALKNVLQSSENFKKSLNEEEEWNEQQQLDILEDPFKTAYVKTSGNERKKRHEQSIHYIKLRVKYWVYFMKLIVNVAILVGVAIWNNVSIHNDVSNIYSLQSQLQFANTASRTLAIAYSGPNEWFYSMDTMLIEGEVPSVKMVSIAQEMKNVQNQAAGVFMGDYETYDPTIKKILFDEGCFIITVTSDLNNCKKIAAQGRPTNFLSVLADFDSLLTQRIALYKASDGSYNALKTIFVNTFTPIIPDFRSTAAQIQLIGGIVNTNLGVAIDKAQKNRNILLIVSSLCLFGVGLTVWYQIMSQLRNMNNNFKKVLQIFPPNLVLSNFILKTFLTKTSRTFAAYMEV